MKVSLSWLNEYVKIDDLALSEITERLLNIGLETEELKYLGEGIGGVFAGLVRQIFPHPNGKLSVCTVDVGDMGVFEIVCGAKNVAEGVIVPAALCGATLPNGKKIDAADFKGVKSFGMLCSGSELGITDNVIEGAEVDGLLILPQNTAIGQEIKTVLGLDDYLLDISVTANRADCQSVYGIARELAAALGRELKPLNLDFCALPLEKLGVKKNTIPTVKITDKQLCPLYTGAIVTDIRVEKSPQFLRRRLYFAGINSKNNIVDITNYVLLEVGQPLHAFDLDKIEGGIEIRTAKAHEKLTALNGESYELAPEMLVIADGIKPLAIAGVMGGATSAVSTETSRVFLEAARFARGSVRTTSRALGLRSDSSGRFEKGVDFSLPDLGRRRALALFAQLSAGKIVDLTVSGGIDLPKDKVIEVEYRRICDILGITPPIKTATSILTALGFLVNISGKSGKSDLDSVIKVTVPAFREDVDNFTDLAEEIIRFYGYDKLTATPLKSGTTAGGISKKRENINKIEQLCTANGALEINNYSFIPARHFDLLMLPQDSGLRQAIKILNPLSEDYAVMRTQLISSMLDTVRRNHSRQNTEFALFEIDNIFVPHALPLTELPDEILTLSMGFSQTHTDFYAAKSFVTALLDSFRLSFSFSPVSPAEQPFLHPHRSANIMIGGKNAGYFGAIHPLVAENFELLSEVYVLQLDLSGFIEHEIPITRVTALPKYPFVERDLAVVAPIDMPAGDVLSIAKNAHPLIKKVGLFDVYTGSQVQRGHKSLALSVVLQGEKTLTDADITGTISAILKQLEAAGITLR